MECVAGPGAAIVRVLGGRVERAFKRQSRAWRSAHFNAVSMGKRLPVIRFGSGRKIGDFGDVFETLQCVAQARTTSFFVVFQFGIGSPAIIAAAALKGETRLR